MIFTGISNKRYVRSVPYSDQEYWGVKFDGKDGWSAPEGAAYDSVRELASGTTVIPSVGGLHTWDDWESYWTDVSIGAPDVETYTVDIPGRHGLLDLSEILTGAPVFKNRAVEITLTYPGSGAQWHEEYSNMLEEIHGRTQQMVFDSDPGYYYEGRCTVSSQRQNNFYSTFTITMDANPFKYAVDDSLGDWLWDPFSFEDGVIRELGKLTIRDTDYENGWVSVPVSGLDYDTEAALVITSNTLYTNEDIAKNQASTTAFQLVITADDGTVLYEDGASLLIAAPYAASYRFTIPAGASAITVGLDDSWNDWWTENASGLEFEATFAIYFREKRL